MWNTPTREQLGRIPRLYQQEEKRPAEVIIYAHFFVGGCDWFITEYDGDDTLFGFAVLAPGCGEWGYVSFSELRNLKVNGLFDVEFDAHWTPTKAGEIEKIVEERGCGRLPAAPKKQEVDLEALWRAMMKQERHQRNEELALWTPRRKRPAIRLSKNSLKRHFRYSLDAALMRQAIDDLSDHELELLAAERFDSYAGQAELAHVFQRKIAQIEAERR